MGRIIYPIYEMENNPAMFETTNQLYIYTYIHCIVTNSMCIFVHVPYHMKSTCTIQKSQPNQHPTSRWLLAKLVYRWIT